MDAIKKLSAETLKSLREPFPDEAITQHPTKTFLSTIKAMYITERLNAVFGICGWDITHEIVSDDPNYVVVRGRIHLRDYGLATPDQYGGHQKSGTNTEPADGYKSAVTDCQSKCASYLEIGIDVFKGLIKSDTPHPERRATRLHTAAGQAVVATDESSEFYCPEHRQMWFLKGRMKEYAHPVADGQPWCNMKANKVSPRKSEPESADSSAAPAIKSGQQIYEEQQESGDG